MNKKWGKEGKRKREKGIKEDRSRERREDKNRKEGKSEENKRKKKKLNNFTNLGVTFLGKNGLSFHIDAFLLMVEREMWKSTDCSKICGFWCRFTDFQKKKRRCSPLDPHYGMKTDCQFY